jgi:hypothetical protein
MRKKNDVFSSIDKNINGYDVTKTQQIELLSHDRKTANTVSDA